MILAGCTLLRWMDRRPVALMGISLTEGWYRDLGLRLLLGFAMLSAAVAVLYGGDSMQVQYGGWSIDLAGFLLQVLFLGFLAGLGEELLLRGYAFQALIEGTRPWVAVLALSVLFGLMHVDNPSVTVPAILNLFLGGTLLSVCYLKTRSLWLPIGIHMS